MSRFVPVILSILLMMRILSAEVLTLSDTADIRDSYMNQADPTAVYGSADTLKSSGSESDSLRLIISFDDLGDTLQNKLVDSAFINLVIKNSAGISSDDALKIWAVKVDWSESSVCWNNRNGSGLEAIPWDVAGCLGASSDYYDLLLDSIPIGWAGDTLRFNFTEAIDSGWINYGLVLDHYGGQYSSYVLNYYSSEHDSGWWCDIYYREYDPGWFGPAVCGENEWDITASLTHVSRWERKAAQSGILDSMTFRIDSEGDEGDTIWGVVYDLDSNLVAHTDSIVTGAISGWIEYSADFPDDIEVLAQTEYLIGIAWSSGSTQGIKIGLCTSDNSISVVDVGAGIHNPLTGDIIYTDRTGPCARVYYTSNITSGRRARVLRTCTMR